MATELVMETEAKPLSWRQRAQLRVAMVAGSGLAMVGAASAAIDFSNISELLQAIVGLVPDFIDLVIGVAPLIVTIA